MSARMISLKQTKLPKSTKITAFNTLNKANETANQVGSSLSNSSTSSVNSSGNQVQLSSEPVVVQQSYKDMGLRDLKEGMIMADMFQNGMYGLLAVSTLALYFIVQSII